jgi:hypothetical protein
MCFSHANGHMSILYVDCIIFPTNRFVGKLCPYIIFSILSLKTKLKQRLNGLHQLLMILDD